MLSHLSSALVSPFPSPELRELELKLKSAYLNKERAAQIAEHEAMRLETVVRVCACELYGARPL